MDKAREAMIDQDGTVWEKIGGAWSLYKPTTQSIPDHVERSGYVRKEVARAAMLLKAERYDDVDDILRALLVADVRVINKSHEERIQEITEALYRGQFVKMTIVDPEKPDVQAQDAKRYQWLRYNASYSIHEMLFGKPAFITTHKESDLDDAIDAVIDAIAIEGAPNERRTADS